MDSIHVSIDLGYQAWRLSGYANGAPNKYIFDNESFQIAQDQVLFNIGNDIASYYGGSQLSDLVRQKPPIPVPCNMGIGSNNFQQYIDSLSQDPAGLYSALLNGKTPPAEGENITYVLLTYTFLDRDMLIDSSTSYQIIFFYQ